MKIYTKTGDKGETGIIGKRLMKDSVIVNTLGSLDEFNASLGICVAYMSGNKFKKSPFYPEIKNIKDSLLEIQSDIFSIGAIVANGKSDIDFIKRTEFLESEIDRIDVLLDPIQNFILPVGSILSSHIHFARTLCRKAERYFVAYISQKESEVNQLNDVLKYLNRLSDYLFTLARYVNKLENVEDIIWK